MRFSLLVSFLLVAQFSWGQNAFVSDPDQAKFITSDIPRFWEAFDHMNNADNPFEEYLEGGSAGLKDFIPYRIESPENLRKVAREKKADYQSVRATTLKVPEITDQIRGYYQNFKMLYSDAVFPPTFFVIGAYNSGGTASKNGLIIGMEMKSDISRVPVVVAHELIHFNQTYPREKNTLLLQSVTEGSADFLAELMSGEQMNETAFAYGEANEATLCREFVKIMGRGKYKGWLYGSSGKKKGRPNDLGYWIGYKITKAYYDKQADKRQAIRDILNIKDVKAFVRESGYLEGY